MSWELANEKWIDGFRAGLLGQFASGRGYSDLVDAIEAAADDYPALMRLIHLGATTEIKECSAELKKLAAQSVENDADTANALGALMDGQEFVMIASGCS